MKRYRVGAAFLLVVLVAAACRSHTATPSPSGTPYAPPEVSVRWFIGLGSGSQADAICEYCAVVKNFNATNMEGITLKVEAVPTATAYDTLKSEMALGTAPDIIGPVGTKGLNGFEGLFLDLSGQVAKNNVDLTAFEPALVEYMRRGADGLIGLPYLIYPGYVWYNKDLFAKADLPPLPTRIGEPYQGKAWDWDNFERVAGELTVDSKGRKSTAENFDPSTTVQYGMSFQWSDLRRTVSCFGGGSFVAPDGRTAEIPAVWRSALNWYYDAVWRSHISPNLTAINSTYLAGSNTQSSGHVAMNVAWAWSISSIASDPEMTKVKNWDIGVMPSWQGTTSSPMDADTFVISKASKHPDETFKVMLAILADPALQRMYGGIPAQISLRAAYFASFQRDLDKIYSDNPVSWSVLSEMAKVPTMPSHESNMPNFTKSDADVGALWTKIQNSPGLDVDAELAKLRQALQADFDAAQTIYTEAP